MGADESKELGREVACVNCGYDLRAQPPDGNCPECNTPTRAALEGHPLRFAPRWWLTRVIVGLRLVLWSWFLMFPLIFWGLTALESPAWVAYLFLVGVVLNVCAGATGLWLATVPRFPDATWDRPKIVRCILALMTIAVLSCGVLAAAPFGRLASPLITGGGVFATALAFALGFRYIALLLHWLNEPEAPRVGRFVTVVWGGFATSTALNAVGGAILAATNGSSNIVACNALATGVLALMSVLCMIAITWEALEAAVVARGQTAMSG